MNWNDAIIYCLLILMMGIIAFMYYTNQSEVLACNEHWQVEMSACVCDPTKQVYKPLDIPEIYKRENVTLDIS